MSMSVKTLIDLMNEHDVRAFPNKNGKGVHFSAVGEDGTRFFINRVATNDTDKSGRAVFRFTRGNDFKPQE